jgi:hypothetical protein
MQNYTCGRGPPAHSARSVVGGPARARFGPVLFNVYFFLFLSDLFNTPKIVEMLK